MYLKTQIQNLIQASKQQESYEPYYEVLEKVTLTGKQYFNIGIQTSDNLTFECGFKLTSGASSNGIFGGRHDTGRTQSNWTVWTGYEVRKVGSSGYTQVINRTRVGQATSSQDIAINTFYNMKFLPTSLQLNNTSITLEQGTSIEQPMDIYLGAINNDGTATAPMTGDLTYFKIFNNGVLVSDCVPALNAQLEVCMYDRVRKILIKYSNISGETEAPTYTRWNKFDVDYIESTGTQYIDTKYIPTNNSVYKFKAECTEDASGVRTVFGSRNTNDTASSVAYLYNSSSNARWATNTLKNNIATALEPHTCTLSKNGYEVDGINEQFAGQTFTGTSTNSIFLFAIHLADGTAGSISKIKCWNFSIEENGVTVRSYKPTVWHNGNTTAVACLYDEVYNKMYTNAGTGSFKAYILSETTSYTLNDGVQNDDYYLAENGTKTVSADHTSCYSNAFAVKQGDIIEWTVTAEQVSANKRIHGYTTNADIEVGTTGSWVQMLAKIVFSTTSDTTQTATFTVPSGINYIRVSHANVRESVCTVKRIRTYEVGSNCLGNPSNITGTSNCFDTGIYGNQDMQVKLISYIPSNTNTSGQLFGSYYNTEANNFTINSSGATGTTAPIRFDGQSITTPIKLGANTKVTVVSNKNGLWVDNAKHSDWSGTPVDFTTQTTLLVVKCNNSSNVRENGCCYLLIEENQTPIAEYIPVKNAGDSSSYGLYDRVSGTLNTGIGTITFNALS